MSYRVSIGAEARKFLKAANKHVALLVQNWIDKNLVGCVDPFAKGRPLVANKAGLWRYRVQNLRIVCKIDEGLLVILVVNIGHRREIYRSF